MKKRLLQDYSLIHQNVERAKQDFGLASDSNAFYFVALPLLLDLQDDEVDNAITDNFYQKAKHRPAGKDRGIDGIFVDSSNLRSVIHLFNCKYVSKFEKTESFFPAAEIDKIESFLSDLMGKELELLNDVNAALSGKVKEVLDEIEHHNPDFVVHIVSNTTELFEPMEQSRFERILNRYSNFTPEYHSQGSLAARLARKGRVPVNGKIKAIDRNLFEIPGGDVRALVLHVDAIELLRLLSDREQLRDEANLQSSDQMKDAGLLEDAFEDNIRLYLRQRSTVNKNIKETALSDDNHRFFYFNNGITITCDRFSYPKGQRGPIVELENMQVVNGGQTMHALWDAYHEDPERLKDVQLLCRMYETKDRDLSSRIAECTNSQSPVKTRDIHSIDLVQIKLEKEFKALGLFYERKKNQFPSESKSRRIDAEKCGQVALAFWEDMPLQAKNKKGLIFGEKYDDIFSDDTTAYKLLLPYRLFEHIEKEKEQNGSGGSNWLRYASYHILYALRHLADSKKIDLQFANLERIRKLYTKAKRAVSRARKTEVAEARKQNRDFADVLFFKSNTAKKNIDAIASTGS